METWLLFVAPIGVAIITYFVRVESRLAKILTDLCWIKKELKERG